MQRVGQPTDVVVRLDRGRFFVLGAGRFDYVRIDGALGQPFGVLDFRRLALEDFDELLADDLALDLRIGNADQLAHEFGTGIDVDHLHAQVFRERVHDLRGFVQAQ